MRWLGYVERGDSADSADRPSGPSGSSSSSPSNKQDTARVQLTQCLREQGLDVPDAQAPGDLFRTLSPQERQKVQDALRGPCSEFQSRAFGDTTGGHDEGFLDDLTAFTGCLRKQGVDIPDPDPSNPFSVLHSLDQSDPKVAKASAACQDKLAALNGGA